VAWDARTSAPDLPDGTSGIFFGVGLDSAEWESGLICPAGNPVVGMNPSAPLRITLWMMEKQA
jgi:hypothetical protein